MLPVSIMQKLGKLLSCSLNYIIITIILFSIANVWERKCINHKEWWLTNFLFFQYGNVVWRQFTEIGQLIRSALHCHAMKRCHLQTRPRSSTQLPIVSPFSSRPSSSSRPCLTLKKITGHVTRVSGDCNYSWHKASYRRLLISCSVLSYSLTSFSSFPSNCTFTSLSTIYFLLLY